MASYLTALQLNFNKWFTWKTKESQTTQTGSDLYRVVTYYKLVESYNDIRTKWKFAEYHEVVTKDLVHAKSLARSRFFQIGHNSINSPIDIVVAVRIVSPRTFEPLSNVSALATWGTADIGSPLDLPKRHTNNSLQKLLKELKSKKYA